MCQNEYLWSKGLKVCIHDTFWQILKTERDFAVACYLKIDKRLSVLYEEVEDCVFMY